MSHHVQREICRKLNLPRQAVRVIYNGLPNAAALGCAAATAVGCRRVQIGFLGRLIPPKRPLDVFELSVRLNRMGVAHVWRVFGDGVLLPDMRREAAARAGPFGGGARAGGNGRRMALAQMDLLCFLARGEQEGLGMVLLEALAANRLIVAWDAGCIRRSAGRPRHPGAAAFRPGPVCPGDRRDVAAGPRVPGASATAAGRKPG